MPLIPLGKRELQMLHRDMQMLGEEANRELLVGLVPTIPVGEFPLNEAALPAKVPILPHEHHDCSFTIRHHAA